MLYHDDDHEVGVVDKGTNYTLHCLSCYVCQSYNCASVF